MTQLHDLDEALYCKSFLLINKLVSVSKPSLTGTVAEDSQNWIFDALAKNNGIKFECFKSLTVVLKHSDNISPKVLQEICQKESNVIMSYLQKCSTNKKLETDAEAQDTLIVVVRTVEVTCYKSAELSEWQIDGIERIAGILSTIMLSVSPSNFGSKYFAFAGSCLNVFNHLLNFRPTWIENGDNLQFVLGCFKAFASVDEGVSKPTNTSPSSMMMPDDEPSLLYEASPLSNKKKKKPRVTNKSKRQNETPSQVRHQMLAPVFAVRQSSDSEQSDTESPHGHTRHRLKFNVMTLLLTTCQVTDRRKLFGNWYIFFDELPSISLLSIMRSDPSAKCRSMALQTASVIIFKVRQYLQHAELWYESHLSLICSLMRLTRKSS